MVATYQFICQVREPIVFKQPEQEMLADSTVDTHHLGGREVIDVQPSRLPNSPIIMAARAAPPGPHPSRRPARAGLLRMRKSLLNQSKSLCQNTRPAPNA